MSVLTYSEIDGTWSESITTIPRGTAVDMVDSSDLFETTCECENAEHSFDERNDLKLFHCKTFID